ncbi:MAG: Gfo/Idh/MocA family oxidoreductase [Candidatus Marinimicrobia bacterium]|nr:Gfo/Idh/MocA family oxidoreductase [FCB group bacterium]MBL7025705.1 Gfo/Idh/MocA family oxidoreductase [Candidatus Neomarinimicrobiota bacterium]
MNNAKTLKWGIMGLGNIAHTMANVLKITPQNQLVAVASKSHSRAVAFGKKYSVKHVFTYQEIVNSSEVDIIYVATTHNFHFENAKLALESGKHVLIEKAFTVNSVEARELVNIARSHHLFLMEAIWTRFLPSVNMIKAKIVESELGEIKQINISYGGFVGPDYEKRLNDPDLAGGVTLDMGIYAISFVCYILGELPVEIKSMTRFSESGVDELSNYMFRFPSGCLANISTSYNLKMVSEAMIYGSKGYINFPKFSGGSQFTLFRHDGSNEIKDTLEVQGNNHEQGFIYQVLEVARCIQSGEIESPIIPLNETVAIMEIMDTMRKEWGFCYPFE